MDNEPTNLVLNSISRGEIMEGDATSSRTTYSMSAHQINSLAKIQGEDQLIIFTPADKRGVGLPHNDPFVILAIVDK